MLFLELSTGWRDVVANAVLICWLRERFRMLANKREVGVRARGWDSILALLPRVRGFCSGSSAARQGILSRVFPDSGFDRPWPAEGRSRVST